MNATSDVRASASPLAGCRVLVTGASGFLGSNLCRVLLQAGADLHATSRRRLPAPPIWHQPDLEDAGATRRLLSSIEPEVVYHFAGQVTAAPDLELVLPVFHSLLTSCVNVLVAATEVGCRRVVLAGSLTEPTDPREPPSSPYAAAKLAGSLYGRMFQAIYGLPVVIVRPFMTYGPGQSRGKVVPYVIRSLLAGERPKLSTGRTASDWIYIDDVVDGLARAGHVPGIDGADIDLGSGTLVSLRTVVEKIEAMLHSEVKSDFGAVPERPPERSPVADVEAAERRLAGWRPSVSLDEGLRRTIESLRR